MAPFNYAPYPMDHYMLAGLQGECEVGAISKLDRAQAVFNLFWLSVPNIDVLPGCGKGWSCHYRQIEHAASTIVLDVSADEVLYRKLLMHPTRFAHWFEREDRDHSIYDIYGILGEDAWSATVINRARLSAERMAAGISALERTGNVYNFMRRKVA